MSKRVLTDAPLAPGYLEPGGAYLLTWNPANRTLSKQQFQKIRKAAALGENPTTDWSMGGTGTVKVGAPFLFVEQGAGERTQWAGILRPRWSSRASNAVPDSIV